MTLNDHINAVINLDYSNRSHSVPETTLIWSTSFTEAILLFCIQFSNDLLPASVM